MFIECRMVIFWWCLLRLVRIVVSMLIRLVRMMNSEIMNSVFLVVFIRFYSFCRVILGRIVISGLLG